MEHDTNPRTGDAVEKTGYVGSEAMGFQFEETEIKFLGHLDWVTVIRILKIVLALNYMFPQNEINFQKIKICPMKIIHIIFKIHAYLSF